MADKVRVGIIGTSWWAEAMYLPSLESHPSAEVVAVCGRNRERGEEIAEKYGISHVFTDYRELIKKADLDAVVVATPDDLHFPMTMNALAAGLHVLCEKPLASNSDQAEKMYEKAQATRVKHMVLFTWRWQPHFQYLKQLALHKKSTKSRSCTNSVRAAQKVPTLRSDAVTFYLRSIFKMTPVNKF